MKANRRRFLATVAATAGTITLAGCSEDGSDEFEGGDGDSNGNNNDDGSGGDGSSNDIELLSHEMVRDDEGGMAESVSVQGEAENVSGGELDYAQVDVKFYEGDTLAESFLDNINGWAAGETWGFEVQYPGIGEDAAAITDYEIRAGTSL
jgi:hypothetical protein